MHAQWLLLLLVTSFGTAVAQQPASEPPKPAGDGAARRPFTRCVERDDGGQLDVLIATYSKGDATLTLHGAVHVADPEHYRDLQQRFTTFDALLYELVAEAGLRPYPEMEHDDSHILSLLQGGMARGLGLVEQMTHVDYRRPNFVHADLTDEQWEEALEKAGSNLLFEMMSAVPSLDADRDAESKLRKQDFVAAARRGTAAQEMRIAFARVIAEPEAERRHPTVIIEARNERCLDVLQEQLAAGKKKLGIYYGAAHMEHIERRLLEDLGWQRTGEEWVTAWDNRASRFPPVEKGLQQKRYRARQDVDALTDALRTWTKVNAGQAPSWDLLRKAQQDGRLPGCADGVDPWGRAYELGVQKSWCEVRCLGSDGATDDDIVGDRVRTGAPGWLERLFGADDARDEPRQHVAKTRVEQCDEQRREYDAAVARARARKSNSRVGDWLDTVVERVLEQQALALARTQVLVVLMAAEQYRLRHRRVPELRELGDAARLRDDPWGNGVRIVVTASGDIDVRSNGPDGKPGTADDVVADTKRK
ncbi:MAG TPA: hypothetical protein VFD82_20685 [Planctomycetota bacterium]|nr:hypothetical protein [Planctomycetota bacterium]